jgi:hypothetical protein
MAPCSFSVIVKVTALKSAGQNTYNAPFLDISLHGFDSHPHKSGYYGRRDHGTLPLDKITLYISDNPELY